MSFVTEKGKQYSVSTKENGDKFWYYKNKLHREQGPAVELANGSQTWFLDGEKVKCSSQKEFEILVKNSQAKTWYDIKVEAMVPTFITFRVLASDPEEAIRMTKNASPIDIKPKINQRRDLKAIVYDMGSSLIRLTKNLVF